MFLSSLRQGAMRQRLLKPSSLQSAVRRVFGVSPSVLTSSLSSASVSSSTIRGLANSALDPCDMFVHRHIGPRHAQVPSMLQKLGLSSLEELVNNTIPSSIRSEKKLEVGPERSESEMLEELRQTMSQNQVLRSHIGLGYYPNNMPLAILRNILENPKWYTPYTPYAAEIAQGRLEMLLNFQTMVSDLTGLPISNASLLDEGTAAAEVSFCVMLCCFSSVVFPSLFLSFSLLSLLSLSFSRSLVLSFSPSSRRRALSDESTLKHTIFRDRNYCVEFFEF